MIRSTSTRFSCLVRRDTVFEHSQILTGSNPDFFDGKPADISWYPPDTDEKGKKLGEFFNVRSSPAIQ